MSERPEWMKCVTKYPRASDPSQAHTVWCGRPVATFDWTFTDANHAILAIPSSRLQPCLECMTAIRDAAQAYLDTSTRLEITTPEARPSGESDCGNCGARWECHSRCPGYKAPERHTEEP
jgi:radical SAM protein with 4Fe4S-binding SPASM domain